MRRQPVEIGPETAREAFEVIERAGVLERFGIHRECDRGGVAAGTSTGIFLEVLRVRCRVRAQEEARITGSGGLEQRLPVRFALEDRQAEIVRPQVVAGEQRVAGVQEVLRRDGGTEVARRSEDHVHRLARGDVFEHDLQGREIVHDPQQQCVHEYPFAVEHVDFGRSDFAMQREDDPALFHFRQDRVDPVE